MENCSFTKNSCYKSFMTNNMTDFLFSLYFQTYVVVFLLILLTFKSVGARAVRKSCGKYLADRISDLCKARGGYSQLTSADSEQRSHRRTKRGIVEECCRQSCTDTILMQYCMEQVEQPEEVVMSNEESKSTTPPTTARTVEQLVSGLDPPKTSSILLMTVSFSFLSHLRRDFHSMLCRWSLELCDRNSTELMPNTWVADENSTTVLTRCVKKLSDCDIQNMENAPNELNH